MREKYRLKTNYTQTIYFIFICGLLLILDNYDFNGNKLLILSWINNISFIIQLRLHKSKFGDYGNPATFFTVFLYLFSSGQFILYSLGAEIDGFNIFERLNHSRIEEGLVYIIIAFLLFQIGLFLATQPYNIYKYNFEKQHNESYVINQNLHAVGWLLFLISLLPYLIFIIHKFIVVTKFGYSAYYKIDGIRLDSIFLGVGNYIFTGLIFLASSGNKKDRRVSVIIMLIIATMHLLSGDRGDGIVSLLTIYLIHIHFNKKGRVNKRKLLLLVLLLMSFVPTIAVLRHNQSESFFNILRNNNPIISTFSNLGGTAWPLVKIMEIFPEKANFILGQSYLSGLVRIIPSFFRFGSLDSLVSNNLYGSPANWLMNFLGMSYGPGFTPFAESYMNFGWGGIFVMLVYGFLMGKILSPNYTVEKDINLKIGMGILAHQILAMSARGSFNTTLSFSARYILIPYLLLKFLEYRNITLIIKERVD